MKLFQFALLAFCFYLFSQCSGGKPETVTQKNKIEIPYSLKPENIYRADSIAEALKNATALQKAESRRLFMTGLDLMANKNDASASIEYFKEAVYFYPDEKNYLHLFKAYLKNSNLNLADSINATLLANKMEYPEYSFNQALIYAATKDTAACLELLSQATMSGFAFKDRITEEKLFDFMKENQSFQSFLVSNFGNDEKIRKTLFKAFLKNIPPLDLPFEMISDSAAAFSFDKYINYDFALFIPGMEDTRFSRDVSNEYMYVGKFKCEEGQALIYKSYQMIADTLNPVSVNLIVYDTLGNVVGEKEIGCFCSPLESKGFKIWQDLSFEVSTFKSTWAFDPLEKGYAGNKVLSKEQSAHNTYKISKDNQVKETHIQAQEEVAASEK